MLIIEGNWGQEGAYGNYFLLSFSANLKPLKKWTQVGVGVLCLDRIHRAKLGRTTSHRHTSPSLQTSKADLMGVGA